MFGTIDYRVFIKQNDNIVSPFHDIQLWVKKDEVANMIVEIPRGTQAKMEINKKEKFNPIAQDIKDGKLRYIAMKYPAHYGAIPQTWENPEYIDTHTNTKGDNDPIDVYDISSIPAVTGDIVQVKILGIFAMIDNGETDWKIVAINIKDSDAHKYNDINDISGDKINELFTFLRDYKIPDGKPPNVFGFNGKPQDKNFTIKIINDTHHEWKKLISGEVKRDDICLERFL